MTWRKEIEETLYTLHPLVEYIDGTICKKYRGYHDNDKRHLAKMVAKRRKRNKSLKTHKRWK